MPAYADDLGCCLRRGGRWLYKGDQISRVIPGIPGRTRLVMQYDGNLVLYPPRGRACWDTATVGLGEYAVYQDDGNFVVYGGGRARWASNTVGLKGETVDMDVYGKLWVGYKPITGSCY
jgi:hypothetical protein